MTENEFWHSTLRKIMALHELYLKENGSNDEMGYIDQLF